MASTTPPRTVPESDPGTVPGQLEITENIVVALLYLCPADLADWDTHGPTQLARWTYDIVTRAARSEPDVRLAELGEMFGTGRFPVDFPVDHKRLRAARDYAPRVMHALVTTA